MSARSLRPAATGAAVAAVLVFLAARAAEPPAAAPPAAQFDPHQQYDPTPLPDRIILTWKGDPATSQAVTWRTDPSVKAGVVQFARAEGGPGFDPDWGRTRDPGNPVRTVPAATTALASERNAAHYHTANLDGLRPQTKYVYRVGDGKLWSEWLQFETAAAGPAPFGFVYFGDAQNGIRSLWSRVVRGAYSDMPKARFIVHAGDLVDRGPSDTDWGEWHAAAGWINGMVPSVPAVGNHEYSGGEGLTAHWRAQFALPANGPPGLEATCYHLDYQGVRVVVLNTEERLAEQAAWLDGVLTNNPNRWTVAVFHRPVYSTAKGRDNKDIRAAWQPLFEKYGVDLVLQGHDHGYGRSGLLRDDNLRVGVNLRPGRGTVYVVSVSGAKLYGVEPLPWAAVTGRNLQLYQLIRVDGGRLTYEARTAAGELYDAFELRKQPDGRTELAEADVRRPPAAAGGGREYGNAVAAVVIVGLVALGIAWAYRRR